MSALSSRQTEQVRRTINAMQEILGRALLAVFLHGSATTTGLRPESDIDLLAMIDRPMSERERKALLTDLLHLSSRLPGAVDDPRRLEVMVIIAAPRKLRDYPARAEFIYGEWLRNEGAGLPMPGRSAENTLILAQTGRNAVVLFGEDAAGYLPKIAAEDIRQALEDAIPPLLDWLHGDERNVLLTLARMGWTTSTGEFRQRMKPPLGRRHRCLKGSGNSLGWLAGHTLARRKTRGAPGRMRRDGPRNICATGHSNVSDASWLRSPTADEARPVLGYQRLARPCHFARPDCAVQG
jgi:streptomycin 3"-adenylyltransferase